MIVIRSDELSSAPSLYHANDGAGSPKAEQSIAIELPTSADSSLGIYFVKVTRSTENLY